MRNLKLLFCSMVTLTVINACSKSSHFVDSKDNQKSNSTSNEKLTTLAAAKKLVVGYIPSWRTPQTVFDNTDLNIVTHINIAFFSPNSSGAMMSGGEPVCSEASSQNITYIVTKAHQKGVKVLASFQGGGVPDCAGNIATLLQSQNRANLVSNIKAFLNYYNLDGIDVDIEGALLSTIKQANNYTPFIRDLKTALQPLGKLVTAASVGYNSGMVPQDSFQYFDYIHIMSYDNGWGGSGNHSTYADAVTHIQNFLNAGCPAGKITLGMPFYGYKGVVGTAPQTAFKTILSLYPGGANVDSSGGYEYNGIKTIEKKTAYAAEHIGGVMIWDLSEDASGSNSLLKAIGRKINN